MEYDPKGMPFRRLGPSGLRVPVFSLGGCEYFVYYIYNAANIDIPTLSGLTLGGTVKGDPVKDIVKTAFENGINMFDTAEEYSKGKCEEEMGRVLKELGYNRSELIISTKLFWGLGKSPNAGGLSRKQ